MKLMKLTRGRLCCRARAEALEAALEAAVATHASRRSMVKRVAKAAGHVHSPQRVKKPPRLHSYISVSTAPLSTPMSDGVEYGTCMQHAYRHVYRRSREPDLNVERMSERHTWTPR